VRRLAALVLIIAAVAGVGTWLVLAPPDVVQRQRYPLEYRMIVKGHARNYRLEPALLAAVIYAESKFHAQAVSASGAIGLMQLLPSTADGIALHTGGSKFQRSDLYDPEINVRYGAWYLRHLIDKYGDEQEALAAYNAGQNNVDRWLASRSGIRFSETRAYVHRVEHLKRIYRRIWRSELGE
jgi:soluble lytic murein transglycosylase